MKVNLGELVLSERCGEFQFRKKTFFPDLEKDMFPQEIDIVKWYEIDPPIEAYDLKTHEKKSMRKACFSIADLIWNSKEPCWEFSSVGTRYLEYATPELNSWILKFCNTYEIDDQGKLSISNPEEI